jgi:hypothetical protein
MAKGMHPLHSLFAQFYVIQVQIQNVSFVTSIKGSWAMEKKRGLKCQRCNTILFEDVFPFPHLITIDYFMWKNIYAADKM